MQPKFHVGLWHALITFSVMLAVCSAGQGQSHPTTPAAADPLHRLAVQLADENAPAASDASSVPHVAPLIPILDVDTAQPGASEQRDASADAAPQGQRAPEAGATLSPDLPRRKLGPALAADGANGKQLAPAPTPFSSGGSNWVLQTITGLGVVIGLILILRYAWTRLTGQVFAKAHSPVLEVLSRTAVAPRNQVLLVRLGQRILVVGDSPAGLRTLANVDDPEEVASLLAAISAAKPGSISQGFSQMLTRFNGDYDAVAVEAEGGDSAEHRVDRARNSISGLLAKLRHGNRL